MQEDTGASAELLVPQVVVVQKLAADAAEAEQVRAATFVVLFVPQVTVSQPLPALGAAGVQV